MSVNWLVAEAYAGSYLLRASCGNFVYVEEFKAYHKRYLKQIIQKLEDGADPKDFDGGVPISWWNELQKMSAGKRIVAKGRFANGIGKTIYFKEI